MLSVLVLWLKPTLVESQISEQKLSESHLMWNMKANNAVHYRSTQIDGKSGSCCYFDIPNGRVVIYKEYNESTITQRICAPRAVNHLPTPINTHMNNVAHLFWQLPRCIGRTARWLSPLALMNSDWHLAPGTGTKSPNTIVRLRFKYFPKLASQWVRSKRFTRQIMKCNNHELDRAWNTQSTT